MKSLRRSGLLPQFGGFLAVGALNTVITLLVYETVQLVLHYAWAYAIALLVGFIYSLIANSKWVFGSGITLKRTARYFLTTVVNLLMGLGVLHVLISGLRVHRALAPLLVIAIILPINFLLSRLALTGTPTGRVPNDLPPWGRPVAQRRSTMASESDRTEACDRSAADHE